MVTRQSSPSTLTSQPTLDMASSSSSPDSDTNHTFTPMGTVEDFFNFDLLSGPSGGETSSRSSSHSPYTSSWNLPPTPKIVGEAALELPATFDSMYQGLYSQQPSKEQEELFTFLNDSPMAFSPSVFINDHSFDAPTLAIDPQLTASTPSSISPLETNNASSSSPDEEHDLETIEEEDEESLPLKVHKVGGKGKSNRKGTVASGGIRKNSVPMTQAVRRDDEPEDEEDWRPTAEEYKKMNSKEKRQLRNKISARNFRVRRKEYITTLEGDIAQRDGLIDVIRTELSSTKQENQSLRREVEALKKALLKGGVTPNLPPPAPLSETIPASATALQEGKSASPAKRQTPLATANTQKDLPLSPRVSNAFWGGRSAFPGAGVTPVHTTLIPEFSPFIPDKLAARAKTQNQEPSMQENINPNLNANPFFGIGHLTSKDKAPTFEGYSDTNLFNFKNMDTYRMHLWQKMGNRPISHPTANGFNAASSLYNGDGLASHLRPSYFSSPTNKSLKDSDSKKETLTHTPQQAVIASLVSQTFVQKLSTAFWDAFASPAPSSNKKDWDAEKVRKVIEGKAVLRVVDLPAKKSDGVDALEQTLKDLAINSQKGSTSTPRSPPPPKEKMMLRPEPCFLQGLRTGTSPLSSKK